MRYTLSINYLVFIIVHMICIYHVYGVTTVGIEYKKDVLDYGNDERTFLRLTSSVQTSTTELHATIVQKNNEDVTATWSFSTHGEHIIVGGGYFFFHHATGLMLAKPSIYSYSPFAVYTSKTNTEFSLCRSGNPVYAMQGLMISFFDDRNRQLIKLNTGVSIKECYVTAQDAENGYYRYSLESLLLHQKKEGMYTYPVHCVTYFAHIHGIPIECIRIDACYYTTRLFYNNTYFLLQSDKGENSGIRSFDGCSVYLLYHDNVFKMFCEYAISKVALVDMNEKQHVNNWFKKAYHCGLDVEKKKVIKLSVRVQQSDSAYYAPWSNSYGGSSPKDVYFYSVSLVPIQSWKVMWNFIDQNNLIPSLYYTEFSHKRIHIVKVRGKISKSILTHVGARTGWFYKDGYEKKIICCHAGLNLQLPYKIILSHNNGYYMSSGKAWYTKLGFKYTFQYLTTELMVLYAHTEKEKMYLSLLPLPNTNFKWEVIDTTSQYYVMRVSYKHPDFQIVFRCFSPFQRLKETCGEISVNAIF